MSNASQHNQMQHKPHKRWGGTEKIRGAIDVADVGLPVTKRRSARLLPGVFIAASPGMNLADTTR